MKIKKIICSIIIVSVFVSLFALPLNTKAKTIKEFEAEVEKYTNELESKKNALATNEAEIAQIHKEIAAIEKQVQAAEAEIVKLQEEIDASNLEIEQKSEESKRILEYYQISNGDNIYLEYAFGATSITDMIYRLSVIEQLTDYNDKIMKELEILIEENKKKQEELTKKTTELKKLNLKLRAEENKIYAESASIREAMPTIEEQIKAAKDNVAYYKKLGCGDTEDIQKCQYRIEQQNSSMSVPSVNGFYRPMQNGYVTQWYTGFGGHIGIDLSSSNKSIDIYPIAKGVVFKIYHDNCSSKTCRYGCNGRAKVVKIRHNIGSKYIYSTYAHLSSFGDIYEGMMVTEFTPIGKMGNTGCSTGPHLHLEISTCDWNGGGGCKWDEYQQRTINPTAYVKFPSRFNNR